MQTEIELLLRLSTILNYDSIKSYIDEIYNIRLELDKTITDVKRIEITNQIKNKVQIEANQAIDNNLSNNSISVCISMFY